MENKPNLTKTEFRRSKTGKASHFVSVWLEDPTLKARMAGLAEIEHRTLNNFINVHVVPKIKEVIATRFECLPDDVKARYSQGLAEMERAPLGAPSLPQRSPSLPASPHHQGR